MSRTERLLDLIQLLRRHRTPVAGPALAGELGISIRTLYRDIATLQAQGADIQGEPGIGYILRPGFTLPPLMFSADEIEALVLGSRWVAVRAADERLGLAATNAISKISAVPPSELRENVDAAAALLVGGGEMIPMVADLGALRVAIRNEHKVAIAYRAADGSSTDRTIWPFVIGFFDKVRVVAGWCELRQDYRSFRIDRISSMEVTGMRYPPRRAVMLKEWREREGVPSR
ncbi:MAG: DNA-binding protein [Devosia sp.]|uniref:helix-turn-helix transcriptional regulator n=1 Tax=Devosia sp. TaxID=1871048 RepID=UPI00260AD78E|nr:YafY family protein [Devosia sp.]MDB5541350.1 DNA-binding protein [Devosia sp.]